jgi:hypothetical protein
MRLKIGLVYLNAQGEWCKIVQAYERAWLVKVFRADGREDLYVVDIFGRAKLSYYADLIKEIQL